MDDPADSRISGVIYTESTSERVHFTRKCANDIAIMPRKCFCNLARMTIVHNFRHILSPRMLDAAVMVCDTQAESMGASLRNLKLQVQTACLVQSM